MQDKTKTMTKYITQKEIAALVEMSPRNVVRYEVRWGLVRLRGFLRPRFDRVRTIAQLRAANALPGDFSDGRTV